MSYWDYEEPVWEPSEADELFDEIKSKLVEAAKASLKNDMEYLKRRNEYLEKRNKELEEKAKKYREKKVSWNSNHVIFEEKWRKNFIRLLLMICSRMPLNNLSCGLQIINPMKNLSVINVMKIETGC